MILRIIRRILLVMVFAAGWLEDRLSKLNRKNS